ncbi:MAG: hypothetical protein AAGJ10_19475 [Bacteroidota bacterium]
MAKTEAEGRIETGIEGIIEKGRAEAKAQRCAVATEPRVIPVERIVPVAVIETAEVAAVLTRVVVIVVVILVFVVIARDGHAIAVLFYLYVIEIAIVLVVVPHGRKLGVTPREPQQHEGCCEKREGLRSG